MTAPKPAKLPRLAETAPGVVSGDVVEMSSGFKNLGFLPGSRPPAEYFNWLFSLGYEWDAYLSDGDLELSGQKLFGTNVAIANAQINNWDPSGVGNLAGLGVVRMTGGGASAVITGVATPVHARILVLFNQTGSDVLISGNNAASTAANRIFHVDGPAANFNVRIPNNGSMALRYDTSATAGWYIYSTSFSYDLQPTEVLYIPAAMARPFGTQIFGTNCWHPNADPSNLVYPLHLPVKSQLLSWKIYANKTSNAGDSISAGLYASTSTTPASGAAQIGSTKTNAVNAPGNITLKETTIITAVGFAQTFIVLVNATAAGAADSIGDLEISYTRTAVITPYTFTP